MPLFSAFCGASTAERSGSIDAAESVNLYRSTVEAEGAAKTAYQIGTPGRRRLGTVPTSGGRGTFTQDGRTWSVVGDTLYELTFHPTTGLVTSQVSRGTINNDGLPVSYASNGSGGQQLAIVGGGELKILDLLTQVLTAAIVLPLTRLPTMIGFLDGYFVLFELNSPSFWYSALEDGETWDALDFATRSTASDLIVGGVCANNRVWVFGSETTEAYEDVGDADNPFQPIKGSLFQIGCEGRWTISIGVSTLRWVGRSARGGAVVYRLDGYSGTRISTHAIELVLGRAATLANAEALTYEGDGHLFYCLSCPAIGDAGATYVIDETEHEWHQRSTWNATLGREEMWSVRGHQFVGTVHVVTAWADGAICALDLDTYDDDGAILRARRRAPYLGSDNAHATIDAFELGTEPGVGLTTGQGIDPQAELRVSKDSAKTWWSAGTASLGPMGRYDDRTVWTRLGQARIDRLVFEVVITDPVKRILGPGAWIRATPGKAA